MTLPVIFLMGPTASGKTDLAVELVQRQPELQIISADSALVYRGLDIGTAKPSRDLLATAPHRLIDICDPTEIYSAGNFRRDALHEISAAHQQGKIPLLVGGTMLYFWVLQQGLAPLPPADPAVRAEITATAAATSWAEVHTHLQQVDPIAAGRIHPHDSQRIQRALEVYQLTGKPISAWQEQETPDFPYHITHFVLAPEQRDSLSARIQQRLQALFARGFIAEVETLRLHRDIHPDLPALRAVGYRQVWEYLDGLYDLPALHERVYYATSQLAKRQLTWLRRWQNAQYLTIESPLSVLCQKVLASAIFQRD